MMLIIQNYLPGILLTVLIAVPAWLIGQAVPVIGSPVLAILFGIIINTWKRPELFEKGISFTSKKLLQYSIILLGFQMSLFQVFKVGKLTLTLMVFTLAATFLTAYFAGKMLKLKGNTVILIGVGTAICGGSAIAATAPVIHAGDEEVAHAVSTIFLFNVIAAFLFPFLGHMLGMNDHTFGLWAGTAVNDTSSVVAAGYSFSNAAGNLAVIVKLTRTLMIIPITLVLSFYVSQNKTRGNDRGYNISKVFPWFVIGFLAASICSTFIPAVAYIGAFLAEAGKFIIAMAMSAIGLNTNLVKLLKNGRTPILLGFICWIVLLVTSLCVQYLL